MVRAVGSHLDKTSFGHWLDGYNERLDLGTICRFKARDVQPPCTVCGVNVYKVKVFNPQPPFEGWRDIGVIVEDYHGYCHRWRVDGTQVSSLVEAFDIAHGLWVHSSGSARSGIFDARGDLVYDAHAPVDLRSHPSFQVSPEWHWVNEFCTAMRARRPDVDTRLLWQQAKALFPANRHSEPWDVVWALLKEEPVPLEWPRCPPSLVQRGVAPGT
jgi:hypothetical protein